MEKRTGVVTFAGNPIALLGKEVKVGDKAPAFTLLDNGLGEKTLADYAGKVKVISVVPSLDTGVCDAQTRWFNQNVSKLGEKRCCIDCIRRLTIRSKTLVWCCWYRPS